MMIGDDVHFRCDACGALHSHGSLVSGNTFGGVLFSDGKAIYPHLPEFPLITKCKCCAKIFWLDKDTNISGKLEGKEQPFKADFLTLADYVKALKENMCQADSDEQFLRHRMLFSFHDPYRFEGGDVSPLFDNPDYVENLERLISLSSSTQNPEELIMVAEFHRYLGQFAEAKVILKSLLGSALDDFARILMKENQASNRCVIVMNGNE
jgi:hypothetical protein